MTLHAPPLPRLHLAIWAATQARSAIARRISCSAGKRFGAWCADLEFGELE